MKTRRQLMLSAGALLSGCAAGTSAPVGPTPAAALGAAPRPSPPPATELAQAQPAMPFDRFLAGVRADARRGGVSEGTLNRALNNIQPLQRVIELDRRQAEAVLSWEEYRDRIVSASRIQNGRAKYAENRALLERIGARYRVDPRVVVAIWGMETNYGSNTGGFGVVESLATLAWEGRRATYFRGELISALRILEAGHIAPERMRGSWAGAMGQPQFMPSNFERLAVDFDGDGRRDIWDNRADALGSIGNYLSHFGWRGGESWGYAVQAPAGFNAASAEPASRSLRDWARAGFRRTDGSPLPQSDTTAAVVTPTRSTTGATYLTLQNFRVIRRYNSPVNYALAVALLAEQVA